ncbi:uncharacterized protein J3D65DRAFT_269419 [Phyllosticta citribraziliensis]|uniref:F-box domain-containing protein n=1 Tax=Phyllosticta citribraziliensis TaxID=989973 RepID=A0ABR1M124_9PEZI
MDAIPNELRLQILSYLDSEPPSTTRFFEEPSQHFACSQQRTLKSLSLVNRSWRRIVIPALFRHARISLGSLQGASRRSTTNRYWLRDLGPEVAKFLDFSKRNEMNRHVKTFVVCTSIEIVPESANDRKINQDQAIDFWDTIFSCIEPQIVKIAAPPTSLATLTGSPGRCFVDAWAFDMPYHLVELRQDPEHFGAEPPEMCPRETRHLNPAAPLMTKRRWSHVGYNEGSSIKAYSLYEYQYKRSPSILGDLLQKDVDSYVPQSLTYVAIFPISENLQPVLEWLISELAWRNQSSPAALELGNRAFDCQLAPDPDSNIMDDPDRMLRAQHADLWEELRFSYNMLGIAFAWPRLRSLTSVTCRDYRCRHLTDMIDDEERLGILRERGWTKVGLDKWMDLRDRTDYDPTFDLENLSLT